ncbi:nuclear transport factor 2 family protein [Paraburkholderia sp. JHI869]|uniref:nuclear transport factor 2 family protein n=1 Tax=Paraburkholderia sp. JHI869 TaxID=3112959 RepID=UPI0031747D18
MIKKLALAAALAIASTAALADVPSFDAQRHFDTIASGDVALLMRGYADSAQFNWVGGPLDGTYTGIDAIRSVWEKFTKAQGQMKVSVGNVEEAENPKGASVTANVVFEGKQPIRVRYVLTYRDARIVSETWQIDATPAKSGN